MIHYSQCSQAAAELQEFKPICDCGKAMTNNERAELMLAGRSDISISEIERALDEAEKRGYDKWLTKEVGRTLEIHYAHGEYLRGQREMRERAAKIGEGWKGTSESCHGHDAMPCCHERTAVSLSEKIRALPIEGE